MDIRIWRGAIVACAFVTAVMALIVGAAGRGETTETTVEDICEGAVWPLIPAICFSRERAPYAGLRSMIEAEVVTSLIEEASLPRSGVTSGKADRLQAPSPSKGYRTVETRGDGVSVLKRVEIESHDQMF
jgi:hypothetical protein